MLAYLPILLLVGVNCIPLDEQPQTPLQQTKNENVAPSQLPQLPLDLPSPPEGSVLQQPKAVPPPPSPPVGGAPAPEDISDSADVNPIDRSGTADLDTDATYWGGYGWGYRPYWSSYYSPWRRWGGYGWGGRSYYGGWGWGGRGYGYGGRGWGWRSGYWG